MLDLARRKKRIWMEALAVACTLPSTKRILAQRKKFGLCCVLVPVSSSINAKLRYCKRVGVAMVQDLPYCMAHADALVRELDHFVEQVGEDGYALVERVRKGELSIEDLEVSLTLLR